MSCKLKIGKANHIIEEQGGGVVNTIDSAFIHTFELNEDGFPLYSGGDELVTEEKVKFVSFAPKDSVATSDVMSNLLIKGKTYADPHVTENLTDTIIELTGVPSEWFENPYPKEELRQHIQPMLNDLKPALQRIIKAVAGKKKLMIYGDFDTDGITSTRIMLDLMGEHCSKKTEIVPYIPLRNDNHGVSSRSVKDLNAVAPDAIIFVDCGSNDEDLIKYAEAHPKQPILILDHHLVDPTIKLPANVELVNSCLYNNALSGAGMAFSAAWALDGDKAFEGDALGYATVGIVGDMVPLNDKANFFMTRIGMDQLNRTQPEWAMKLAGAKVGFQFDGHGIAFNLVNRLNSLNRTNSDSLIGVAALSGQDEPIKAIRSLDNLRKKEIKGIMEEIDSFLAKHPSASKKQLMVLDAETMKIDIAPGYAGLVANKLVETYKKPVMIASNKNENGNQQMSVRSVEGIDFNDDIYSRLNDSGLTVSGGGHPYAGGFSFNSEKFEQLKKTLYKIQLPEANNDNARTMRIPLAASPTAIHSAAIATAATEPHGMNNPEPRFVLDAPIVGLSPVGKSGQWTAFWLQNNPQDEPTRVICMKNYEKMKAAFDEIRDLPEQKVQMVIRANYDDSAEWAVNAQVENIRVGELTIV